MMDIATLIPGFRVPEGFLDEIVRSCFQVYAQAYARTQELVPFEEAHYLYPHMRRALFEARLRALVKQFDGVTAEAVLNKSRNCYHTEIRVGPFVLTESLVDAPGDLPRPAEFRQRGARLYQLAFDFYEDKAVPREGLQFAVIQHGDAVDEPWRPAFIELTFPNEDYTAFRGRIDLLARYAPDVAADDAEIIEPVVEVKLREREKEGGA